MSYVVRSKKTSEQKVVTDEQFDALYSKSRFWQSIEYKADKPLADQPSEQKPVAPKVAEPLKAPTSMKD